eukprot:scaffold43737_cov298-Isochrysis_galbana.AAC.3
MLGSHGAGERTIKSRRVSPRTVVFRAMSTGLQRKAAPPRASFRYRPPQLLLLPCWIKADAECYCPCRCTLVIRAFAVGLQHQPMPRLRPLAIYWLASRGACAAIGGLAKPRAQPAPRTIE